MECENNYTLFNYDCIEQICFSEFCVECSLNLKKECEVCFQCKNLKFITGLTLKCSEKIYNCEFCFFKLYSELKCLICENDYIYDRGINKCINKKEINKDIFNQICQDGFYYDEIENKCFFISYDCFFGCKKCWGEKKSCLQCSGAFNLINLECNPKKDKDIIFDKNSKIFKEIIPFFYYNKNSCFKIINNITIFIEKNITSYLDEKNFIHEKISEKKEFFIDCSKDKNKCLEYNKLNINFSTSDLNSNFNCENQNQEHIYEKIIFKYLNITINNFVDFCPKSKIDFYLKNEEIFCKENCSHYKKIENYVNLTHINICKNKKEYKYFKDDNHRITEYNGETLKKKECDYCQKKLNYFCSSENDCNNECKFDVVQGHSGISYLKNKNKNVKIDILIDLIIKDLPDYIKVKLNYNQQWISFRFLKNIKEISFELKLLYIKTTKNCSIKKNQNFIIKNTDYFKFINFETISFNDYITPSTTLEILNIGLSTIIPFSFFKLVQFFDLFCYFTYMEIDGGSYFNFISNLHGSFYDKDKELFISYKEYEYMMILSNLKALAIFSIFDYLLIFGIILNYSLKFFLDKTKYYRFKKSAKLLKKLIKKRKKYYSLNIFQKVFYLIQYRYITTDPYTIVFCHKKILFAQNIFNLPTIIYIFYKKYDLIDKKYFIIYYFIFFMISYFLLEFFIRIYQFLRIDSISLYPEVMIVRNKEENWFLVFYQFIFFLFNFLNLFLLFIFKSMPLVCFGLIIVILIIQIIIILIFSKKSLRCFIFFEILTLIVFLFWIIFVFLDKCFHLNYPLILNIFYVTANVSKIISEIVLTIFICKMKKEIKMIV